MKSLVLTVFFLLELAAMIAFGYWGYHIETAGVVKVGLAIAVPLVVIVMWGMFLAPKASYPVFAYPTRSALKLLVFVLAFAALYASGQATYAVLFLVISVITVGTVFMKNWHHI
ncbi:YrdB family protein [Paenibacillus sp. PR3]|uniref:YrdB family protein n=1 Tax=Paenibacillus terricola TaxID=2763503 RepID=A0ABR8MTJ9_9BACL|nr:YrdB family protein [Paenibacillus terricola]MBD3919280.1 YrdB family protein [Paenibacillus terricola]